MNKKRVWMISLGTLLVICAIAPSEVADGRLPRWANILWDLEQGAKQAANVGAAISAKLEMETASAPQPGGAIQTPPLRPEIATIDNRLRELGVDPSGVPEALAFYRAGNLDAGDALARSVTHPLARAALEWMALRDAPERAGLARLNAFSAAHPGWPAQHWLRAEIEAHIARSQDMTAIKAAFTSAPPRTDPGKFALARALRAQGQEASAAQIVRALYREAELTPFLEGRIRADFGGDLQRADYKFRADRLLYKDDSAAALRTAALAGPDVVALEKARIASASDKAVAAVPPPLRNDPGLILVQIQKLRRADKIKEAAALMLSAPRDASVLVDPDEWWVERRVLARKVLDTGDAETAYKICAGHAARSPEARIEAEFHAGWIALRFLNKPALAAPHFEAAAQLATTPASIARTAYWQGRTAENIYAPGDLAAAKSFYEKAAAYPTTYYGQTARALLGMKSSLISPQPLAAAGTARAEATGVVEILFAAGEKEAATQLAVQAAQNLTDETQIAALAAVIARQQDAHLSLVAGKIMDGRGFAAEALAFPTFGIPAFQPLGNSAPAAIVYSVARQESGFNPGVVSSAGAKGLMQMIDSTARHTALKAGLSFDESRLLTDAAFNAQLGAAHLGALLAEQGGSYILTFAAYNAGGGHVRDWIAAYGDPRDPGVDAIDWVERIPFTETRNYVQRVMANVGMYQARFEQDARLAVSAASVQKAVAQAKL